MMIIIIIILCFVEKIPSVRRFVQVCAGLCGFVRFVRFVRVFVQRVCAKGLCKEVCA